MAAETVESARFSDAIPDELPKQHELVRGMLVRKAMPRFPHAALQQRLSAWIMTFSGRRRSPGGWWFGTECEIEFLRGERYLPDLAGWRIDRVPQLPTNTRISIPPQWVCEILSPSTAHRDLGEKQQTYHAAHVEHYWHLDPTSQSLTVLGWDEDSYRPLLTAEAGDVVRAEPFDAVEFDLGELFEFD